MPYIDVRIHPVPSTGQVAALARGITDAMAEVVHKRREVTAVRVGADTVLWTIAGMPCTETTAYLDVKITAGTNTREEKTALVQRLHGLLLDTLGELADASYIVVHELPAENWGYADRTQAARATDRP